MMGRFKNIKVIQYVQELVAHTIFFLKSIAIANIQIDWNFPSLLSFQFLSPAISLPHL